MIISLTRYTLVFKFAALAAFAAGAFACASPSTESSSTNASINGSVVNTSTAPVPAVAPSGALFEIEPNGPADTVRAFYEHLREKRFREAIFMTNLRPAVEGLTESELKEFALDFDAIAGQIPAKVQINGEIISGDSATVTANLPDPDEDGKLAIQEIRVKRANGVWIIQTVDEAAEKRIKKEGKRYFYDLRIETHEEEAKKMLERISKAQLAHSLQNGGAFTDIATLVSSGLLPEDVSTSASTGYNYAVELASDKMKYLATATPAEYGKSGKTSYILQLDAKGISRVSSSDNGGRTMRGTLK